MTTVAARGTGRKDYSQNIEFIVEPLIRSYQQQYTYYDEYDDVAPGSSAIVDIPITTGTVAFVYDFRLATFAKILIGLTIQAVGTDGVVAHVAYARGYTNLYHNIPAGFPFFNIIRATYYNLSDKTADLVLSMSGMYTSEKEYHLTLY